MRKLILKRVFWLLVLIAIVMPLPGGHLSSVLAKQASTVTLASSALKTTLPQNSSPYIYKYLIHRNTGGPIACNDTLYPVYVGKRTGNTKQDITIALKSLFSTSSSTSGLFNPLAKSKLRVSTVEYNPKNLNVKIRLNGKLVKPDNYCDIARARAMVWATAQQFPEVRHATIFLGSALLGDLLAARERAKP